MMTQTKLLNSLLVVCLWASSTCGKPQKRIDAYNYGDAEVLRWQDLQPYYDFKSHRITPPLDVHLSYPMPPMVQYQPPPMVQYQPPPELQYQPLPELLQYQPPPEVQYQPPPVVQYKPMSVPHHTPLQPPPEVQYQPPPVVQYQPMPVPHHTPLQPEPPVAFDFPVLLNDYDYDQGIDQGLNFPPPRPKPALNVSAERMGGFGGTGDMAGYGAYEYKTQNIRTQDIRPQDIRPQDNSLYQTSLSDYLRIPSKRSDEEHNQQDEDQSN